VRHATMRLGALAPGIGLLVLCTPFATQLLARGTVWSKSSKAVFSTKLGASGGNPPYKWSLTPGVRVAAPWAHAEPEGCDLRRGVAGG